MSTPSRRSVHRTLRVAVGAAALLAAAMVAMELALRPGGHDRAVILATLGAPATLAVVAVPALDASLRRARRLARSLAVLGAVAGVLGLGSVAAAAAFMFLSDHDLRFVLVVVGLAAGLSALVAVEAGRPLAADARRLGDTAGAIAAGDRGARTGVVRNDELGRAALALDHMAKRLELAEEARERADAERRLLLSSIGHDLRTPLAAVRAALEAVQDGVAPDPVRYLATIDANLVAIEELIDALFLYARIEAGRLDLDLAPVDLAEVVEGAVEAMQPTAGRAGTALRSEARGPVEVMGAASALGRAVRNLVDNAIRHSPRGRTVSVGLDRVGDMVRVRVRDEGDGFPESFRAVAFEPFTRADAARDRTTGTAGLGLAITRGIVEAHGGLTQLGPGPGGCVEVLLPLVGAPGQRSRHEVHEVEEVTGA